MNKLFNKGDYVLLSDCKEFDEKYGLEEVTTMWAVARKMEGGEPHSMNMKILKGDECVGIFEGTIGVWENLGNQLTVEDVLYRSEDGLTIDELSKIHGAFEDGKEYKCVIGNSVGFQEGNIYFANDNNGITDEYGDIMGKSVCSRFKPVTPKPEWVPSVGDEVIMDLICKKVKVEVVFNREVCVSDGRELFIRNVCDLKSIDKEREATIKKVTDLSETLDDSYSPRDFAIALYDAGLLKR